MFLILSLKPGRSGGKAEDRSESGAVKSGAGGMSLSGTSGPGLRSGGGSGGAGKGGVLSSSSSPISGGLTESGSSARSAVVFCRSRLRVGCRSGGAGGRLEDDELAGNTDRGLPRRMTSRTSSMILSLSFGGNFAANAVL